MGDTMLEHSIWIDAPREQVWRAVTDPDQIIRWFAPNLPGATMERDENGTVTVHLGPVGVEFVVLTIVEPLRQVANRTLPDGQVTVTYTLDEEQNGTRFTVTTFGFEALLGDVRLDRLSHARTGWEQTLKNLQAFVGSNELPFPTAFVGPLFGYWKDDRKKAGIERSIWIKAPLERVWDAITDPKQFQVWFSPTTSWEISALEVGGRYYVHNAETNTEMYVEIIELIDPPHRLATRSVPVPPDTIVKDKIYTLKPEDGGTRFTVTFIGYEQLPDEGRWSDMERDAFGFGMMLQNIRAYVEGRELPFPWGF
jgi:uncharacterized protein YndB with AHSA1/START domain